MSIKRILGTKIKSLQNKFPVVAIIGPRQSGKTILIKNLFKDFQYVNLEAIDTRKIAEDDPRGFLFSVYSLPFSFNL